jgi:hypothetical protein
MDAETIYGVDFSASSNDSGHKTWLTEAHPDENGVLQVQRVECAADALDGDPTSREKTLSGLVDYLGSESDAVVGFDFPFSLSSEVVSEFFEVDAWSGLVEAFPEEWSDPKEMFHAVNDAEVNDTRRTDDEHGGQDPTGWRIKTQTYYGIRDVLAPLVEDHGARVGSLHEVGEGPLLLETYPAAVFADNDLHRDGYKDVPEPSREKRTENLRGLQHRGVSIPEYYAEVARHNDDALDSIAAAFGAWHPHSEIDVSEDRGVEGRIYV